MSLKFCRLWLQNWKNFLQVEVDIGDRLFLVGPNASGKSNSLDAFRFLRDLALPGGGFREAIARRGGVSSIRCLAARRYPDVEIRASLQATDGDRWEYQLAFNQDKQRRPAVKKERVEHNGEVVLDRPNDEDKKDSERLTQTYLEQVNVNQPFRDIAFFCFDPLLAYRPAARAGARPLGGEDERPVRRRFSRADRQDSGTDPQFSAGEDPESSFGRGSSTRRDQDGAGCKRDAAPSRPV